MIYAGPDPIEVHNTIQRDEVDTVDTYISSRGELVMELWLKNGRHWRLFVGEIQEVNE